MVEKRHVLSVLALCTGFVFVSGARSSAVTIGLEAELASEYFTGSGGAVWEIADDPDAFGGQAIQGSGSPNNQDESPVAVFNDIPFTEAGTYNLFVRLKTSANQTGQLRVPSAFGGVINVFLISGAISATNDFIIVNLSDLTAAPQYTVTADNLTPDFSIGTRGNFTIVDAIAFSTQDTLTAQEFQDSIIPEPASLALVGLGCLMLMGRRRHA